MIPEPVNLGTQQYQTHCACCGKPFIFSSPYMICNECEETEAPALRIVKLEKALYKAVIKLMAWQTDFEALANDKNYKPEYDSETLELHELVVPVLNKSRVRADGEEQK